MKLYTGTYVGDGTADRVIDIEVTPKALWIYPSGVGAEDTAEAVAIPPLHTCFVPVTNMWNRKPEIFQGIVPNGFKTGKGTVGTNKVGTIYIWIALTD